MMSETGSVKFTCDRVKAKLTRFAGFDELNRVRRRLIDLGLMGVDANGIGFGNLSVRDGETNSFYITGSGSGGMEEPSISEETGCGVRVPRSPRPNR